MAHTFYHLNLLLHVSLWEHSYFIVYKRGGFTSFNPPYLVPYVCLFVGWIKAGGRIHVLMSIIPDLQKIGITSCRLRVTSCGLF